MRMLWFINQLWDIVPVNPQKNIASSELLYLTNRFHVAMCLFSNRTQMTSECGKNKHMRRSRVCHWCSYPILSSSVVYYWIRCTATWNLYNNKSLFHFKIFQHNTKASHFAPPLHEKSPLMWSMIYAKWSNFIGCYA